MSKSLPSGPALRARGYLAAAVVLALPLGACSTTVDRTVATSSIPFDYHERHPVVLANAPERLDIFPVGTDGELDRRSMGQIRAFAATYQSTGQGRIVISAPHGPVDEAAMQRTVDRVRRALMASGVRGSIDIGSYPVGDPRLASPLHLSFVTLQARGTSHCGDWPDDLNSGATVHGWDNRSYYNFGCASGKTFAAQIDDPRDLLGPRADDPSDVQLRTRAIGLLRGTTGVNAGNDPGTNWTGAAPSSISSVGGK